MQDVSAIAHVGLDCRAGRVLCESPSSRDRARDMLPYRPVLPCTIPRTAGFRLAGEAAWPSVLQKTAPGFLLPNGFLHGKIPEDAFRGRREEQ